jgi:hypothetical protein
MRKVHRSEIVDYQTYDDTRAAIRQSILEIKRPRRIHVGSYLTFLFENATTLRYQIQEIMRVERIVREAEIQREVETYNDLLGGPGELACCLLIEIDDRDEREKKLREWRDLPGRIYIRTEAGLVRPQYDLTQVEAEKISAVQYLKWPLGGHAPLAVGCDHPQLTAETVLDAEQRAALLADMGG